MIRVSRTVRAKLIKRLGQRKNLIFTLPLPEVLMPRVCVALHRKSVKFFSDRSQDLPVRRMTVFGVITPVALPGTHAFNLFGLRLDHRFGQLLYFLMLCAVFREFRHVESPLVVVDHTFDKALVVGVPGFIPEVSRHLTHRHFVP